MTMTEEVKETGLEQVSPGEFAYILDYMFLTSNTKPFVLLTHDIRGKAEQIKKLEYKNLNVTIVPYSTGNIIKQLILNNNGTTILIEQTHENLPEDVKKKVHHFAIGAGIEIITG